MRNKLLYFVLALSVFSCSDTDNLIMENQIIDQICESNSLTRSVDEAISIASQSMVDFDMIKSRSNKSVAKVLTLTSFSRAESIDTALYIVNFEDNGFAIVSAKRNQIPLLGISDDGFIDDVNSIDNIGLKNFIKHASRVILPDSVTDYREYEVTEHDTIYSGESPRVTTKWGQRWPEGYLCSNGISGCAVTALVQCLAYFNEPKVINYTYPERDIETEVVNMRSIKNNVTSVGQTSSNFNPVNFHSDYLTLARICRELGYRSDAEYKDNSTSINPYDILYSLPSITTNLSSSSVHTNSLDPEVELGAGILYVWGYRSIDGAGHGWLVDGWKKMSITTKYYKIKEYILGDIIKTLDQKFTVHRIYSHCN